jgi:Asp-tRNA(Asn)/Glu-tRNA(Gln) amidotransferase A subunit family amidase
VEDAAIMLDAIAHNGENYSRDLKRGIHDFVLGVPRKYFYEDLDGEIGSVVEQAIKRLGRMAKSVREVECSIEQDRTVFNAEARAYHRDKIASSSALYNPETLRRLQTGDPVTDADYQHASDHLQRTRANIGEVFRDVDLLITPTIPVPTPRISDLLTDISKLRPTEMVLLRNTRPVNVWGLPAISIPCGLTSQGLPMGLQIIGPPNGELKVLRAAYAFEQGD